MDMDFGGDGEDERGRATSGSKRGWREKDDYAPEDIEIDVEEDGGIRGQRASGASRGTKDRRPLRDKAEIIRRRNCENARKARARKKMEVTQLQDQATQLKLEHTRGKEEARKAREARIRAENERRQTLRTFMRYRCSNVKSYQEWAEVVEETFTLTLPITPYRWFSCQDVMHNSRILRGIHHLMTDNGSLAVLIESLGCGTLLWRKEMEKGRGHGVEIVCDIRDEDMIITGDTVMCCYLLRTTNAMRHGTRSEWFCRGMMSAKFSPGSSKLAAVEHVFDVTSLMQQLQRAVGEGRGTPVVPNTPMGACQPSQEARMITTATPPFAVVSCNDSWTKLSGYHQDHVKGLTMGMLDGPNTDAKAITSLMTEIQSGQAASSLLINYKHDGSSFLNYLRVYPLIGDSIGTITHFLGVSQEQPSVPGDNGDDSKSTVRLQRGAAAVAHSAPFSTAFHGMNVPTIEGGDWINSAVAAAVAPTSNPFRPRLGDTVRSSSSISVGNVTSSVESSTSVSLSTAMQAPDYFPFAPSLRNLEFGSEPASLASTCKSSISVIGEGAGRCTAAGDTPAVVDGISTTCSKSSLPPSQSSVGDAFADTAVLRRDAAAMRGMSTSRQEETRYSRTIDRDCKETVVGGSLLKGTSGSETGRGPGPGAFEGGGSSQDGQDSHYCTSKKRDVGRLGAVAEAIAEGNSTSMESSSERHISHKPYEELPARQEQAPPQTFEVDEEKPKDRGVEGQAKSGGERKGSAARVITRSQHASPVCESPQRAEAVDDVDVNSLCNSFGRHSTGGTDSPDTFLAWEDVLVGPGDPLQELGAAHVQEELDEAGVRATKEAGDGAMSNCQAGPSVLGTGRQRAGSDSVVSISDRFFPQRPWQADATTAMEASASWREEGSDAGLCLRRGWSSRDMIDSGERELRAVSDSAAWECVQPAAPAVGIRMKLGRSGGMAQMEGARCSAGNAPSMLGLKGDSGGLTMAKLGQGSSGGYALNFVPPVGVGARVPVGQGGSVSLGSCNENDDLMLTQEALFRSATSPMGGGANEYGGGGAANVTNATLSMLNLLDPAAIGLLPYNNLVGFGGIPAGPGPGGTGGGAVDWKTACELTGETCRPGEDLLGSVDVILASDGKQASAAPAKSLPGQGLAPRGHAPSLLRFQLAPSWPTLMDPNIFQAVTGVARRGLRTEMKSLQGFNHQQQQQKHQHQHQHQHQHMQQQQLELGLEPTPDKEGTGSNRNISIKNSNDDGMTTSPAVDANIASPQAQQASTVGR